MKNIAYGAIVIGVILFIMAVISRLTVTPIYIVRGGIEAEALLSLTNTFLLVAIIALQLEK